MSKRKPKNNKLPTIPVLSPAFMGQGPLVMTVNTDLRGHMRPGTRFVDVSLIIPQSNGQVVRHYNRFTVK